MATFENSERRAAGIAACCAKYGIKDLDEAREICLAHGIDVEKIVKGVQPICFDNAVWAYTLGVAIGLKDGVKTAVKASELIGVGLQAFCVPGSVAQVREVGLGHGNLGAMLLSEETKCFCFLAKDAAYIISRINGFTYVQTDYDFATSELKIVREVKFSDGERANIRCYGANDVSEGVAIMQYEDVDVSITGNSTNPTRFQHPVAGTYKNWAWAHGKKYFSVASGGGTGRTLHPDNMAAGPSSYGLTDTMGRMHADAQFAGSSSVPAHVEMMGLIGMGNNPMVGATVSGAVAVYEANKDK